tara:strand:- start:4987 stop:5379 length:393 start_codon:yes stop_codon:yes gene_type:complete
MAEENKNAELIPYLEKLISSMDNTLDKLQTAVGDIDKMVAIQDERISNIQEELIKHANAAAKGKNEVLLQIKKFRDEYKEKQYINQKRLSVLENSFYKWKWIISSANAVVFLIFYLVQIEVLNITIGTWN